MKRTKQIFKALAISGLAIVLFTAATTPVEKYFDIAKSLDIYATLFKEVNTYYVDEIKPEELVKKSIDGMLETLDPYTTYIPEEEVEDFRITTTGQYGGIGAMIGKIGDRTVITFPYEGFPAQEAGLQVGDEIVSVNGIAIQGKNSDEVSNLLKGQPHTDVEIKVHRYGVPNDIDITLKRDRISVKNVTYADLVAPVVGYILLEDFTPGAGREVGDAVESLKKKGATRIILDLRNNPGGLLTEAVNVVNVFIPKGTEVVSTKGRVDDWNKSYSTLNPPIDTAIPLAVLVNGNSASASEIVAGSLQDYDRAILVGQRTFGKGLVQTTRPLAYDAQLKVTTAKYYIPSGRCIQELDYSHRKADGTVEKVPDSLRNEFKTKNGRPVFDGGGLEPDIVVSDEIAGTITTELLSDGLLFDYASVYVSKHPDPIDYRTFSLSDADYDDFVRWLKEKNFTYTSPIEQEADNLLQLADDEQPSVDVIGAIKSLKEHIELAKATEVVRYKPQIKRLLEEQIGFHKGLNKGRIETEVSGDSEMNEAIKVLNDPSRERKILALSQ